MQLSLNADKLDFKNIPEVLLKSFLKQIMQLINIYEGFTPPLKIVINCTLRRSLRENQMLVQLGIINCYRCILNSPCSTKLKAMIWRSLANIASADQAARDIVLSVFDINYITLACIVPQVPEVAQSIALLIQALCLFPCKEQTYYGIITLIARLMSIAQKNINSGFIAKFKDNVDFKVLRVIFLSLISLTHHNGVTKYFVELKLYDRLLDLIGFDKYITLYACQVLYKALDDSYPDAFDPLFLLNLLADESKLNPLTLGGPGKVLTAIVQHHYIMIEHSPIFQQTFNSNLLDLSKALIKQYQTLTALDKSEIAELLASICLKLAVSDILQLCPDLIKILSEYVVLDNPPSVVILDVIISVLNGTYSSDSFSEVCDSFTESGVIDVLIENINRDPESKDPIIEKSKFILCITGNKPFDAKWTNPEGIPNLF